MMLSVVMHHEKSGCAQDFFFKLGNKNPLGGFGVGKAPFWSRPAFV